MSTGSSYSRLRSLIRYEWVFSIRNRWSDGFLIVFAAAATAVSIAGMTTSGQAMGFERTAVSLSEVTLYLFPLAGLLVGLWGCPWLRDSSAVVCAQPVSRRVLLLGAFVGQLLALAAATGVGFAIAGIVIGLSAGLDGLLQYAEFVMVGVLTLSVFLAIAQLIAASSRSRGRALALGFVVWFVCVVGYDLLLFSAAGQLAGPALRIVLVAGIFLNPVDLARVTALLVLRGSAVFGSAGTVLVQVFGVGAGLWAMLAVLVLWTVVPLSVAGIILRRRDM